MGHMMRNMEMNVKFRNLRRESSDTRMYTYFATAYDHSCIGR